MTAINWGESEFPGLLNAFASWSSFLVILDGLDLLSWSSSERGLFNALGWLLIKESKSCPEGAREKPGNPR